MLSLVWPSIPRVLLVLLLRFLAPRVADPALGNVILQRRKDFIQKPIVARLLGFFGSNVLQVGLI